MRQQGKHFLHFGPFRLETAERVLFRGNEPVPLTPKVLDTLLVLVRNPGRVLAKDELMKMVWPDTFVEESNLGQNIFMLRKALGEMPGGRSYIETIPKRGYRFAAEVREKWGRGAEEPAALPAEPPRLSSRWWRLWPVWVFGLAAAAAALYWPLVAGWRWPTAAEEINSVAVLPFLNLSPDAGNEYFSDGLTEELTAALAKIEGLRVPARTSAFQFKGKAQDIRLIGRQLQVEAVLEGSVRKEGNRLRVSAQLTLTRDGYHLWSETYEEELKDVFALQEHLCRDIVAALRVRLSPRQSGPLVKSYTGDLEVYSLYLKGRFQANRRTLETVQRGLEFYEQAIARDSRYAPAHAGLADAYNLLGTYSILPPGEAFPRARQAAQQALAIDGALAEAHAELATVKAWYEWDAAGAEAEFRQAIALNPAYAPARQGYAEYLSLLGRYQEALREIRRAQQLDPLSLVINAVVALTYYYGRQYDQATEQCRQTAEIDPNFSLTPFFLSYAYEQQGRFEEAIVEARRGVSLMGGRGTAFLGHALAASGSRAEALRVIEELKAASRQAYVSPYWIALVYAGLGQPGDALDWLEKAAAERSNWIVNLKADPRWDGLRSQARFRALLKKAGLE